MQNAVPRNRLQEAFGVETMSWKRTGHGSSARPQRPESMRLRQPQDGATDFSTDPRARVAEIRSVLQSLAGEPDDARLTGGTRSLMRRVMGLNVMALPKPLAPVREALQRSTRRLTAAPALARTQVA
jgi:hypothetical protein